MSAKVGVILSGCGVFDGSEIHEAVAILTALDRRGAAITCLAPDVPQAQVINHLTKKPEPHQSRNVLAESARIARGKIRDLAGATADEFDALVFPGGYGAVKNLCTFAADGADCKVNPDVARLLRDMHAARKPIGMACISPILAARVLGQAGAHPRLTIGSDKETAAAIEKMGGQHQNTAPTEICVDTDNRLVTTPCYMNDVGPWVVFQGAENMVEEVLRLTGDRASMIRSQMASEPVNRVQ